MSKNYKIENLKTATVVVLFFTTILLLYFLWQGIDFKKMSLPIDLSVTTASKSGEIPTAESLITPAKAKVNFGGDLFTEYSQQAPDYWNVFLQEYKEFAVSENVFLEEITEAQWDKTMSYQSIQFFFESNIPFTPYFERIGVGRIPALDGITSFSVMGYSLASKESIFVFDKNSNKFFRLVSDSDRTELSSLISNLQSETYNQYYPIESFFGVKSRTLLPLLSQSSFAEFTYGNEFSNVTELVRSKFAETFFGESFYFVRKITEDNGSIIYVYGYSQKLLTLNPDGKFEYKEEITSTEPAPNTNLFDALDTAILFVHDHGGWKSLNGADFTPYLSSFTEIEKNKKKGYRFTFQLKVNDAPIYYKNEYPIVVDVIGNQVTYYKRHITVPASPITTKIPMEVFPIAQLLPQNYKIFANIFIDNSIAVPGNTADEIFSYITKNILFVDTGYYKIPSTQTYTPVWIITFEDFNVFFQLGSGDYLGYSYTNDRM